MKRYYILLFFLLTGCEQISWQKYDSKEGSFSVLLPGYPQKRIDSYDSPVGPLKHHFFFLNHKKAIFNISYIDYPDSLLKSRSVKDHLDNVRNSIINNNPGKFIKETTISYEQNVGRELLLTLRLPSGSVGEIRWRLLLVGNRLYQVGIATPGENSSKNLAQKKIINTYFNSFTIKTVQ